MLMIHKDDIQVVLVDFIDKHILPKASGWHKFAAGAVSFLITQRVQSMLDNPSNISMLVSLDIMNTDGLINMDFLKEMALASFNVGGSSTPPIFGCMFDKSDIENLYTIATQFKQG